jgi:hypothetical protein
MKKQTNMRLFVRQLKAMIGGGVQSTNFSWAFLLEKEPTEVGTLNIPIAISQTFFDGFADSLQLQTPIRLLRQLAPAASQGIVVA